MSEKAVGPDTSMLWATLYKLKEIPRTGWVDRGIPAVEAESVADHSFFTMLLAWVVAHDDSSLDSDRVLQLALIHDAAEAIAGDIPPYNADEIPDDPGSRREFFAVRRQHTPASKARKQAIEAAAAEQLMAMLPESIRDGWHDLWHEYEAQETPEARLVKDADRLEVFIQSRLYAAKYPDAPVEGFTDMAIQGITHPALVKIRDAFLEDTP